MADRKRKPAAKGKSTSAPRKTTSKRNKKTVHKMTQKERARRNQNWAFALFVLALFSIFSLFCDAEWLAWIDNAARTLMGSGVFVLPICLLFAGVLLLLSRGRPIRGRVICSLIFPLFIGACVQAMIGDISHTASFSDMAAASQSLTAGGVVLGHLTALCTAKISRGLTILLYFIGTFFVLLTACNITVVSIWEYLRDLWLSQPHGVEYEEEPVEEEKPEPVKKSRRKPNIDVPLDGEFDTPPEKTPAEILAEEQAAAAFETWAGVEETTPVEGPQEEEPEVTQPESDPEPEDKPDCVPSQPGDLPETEEEGYRYPPLSLLKPAMNTVKVSQAELSANAQRLIETIKSFGIEVHLVNVVSGPAVTRYEVQLDPGVKFSRLVGLSDDIALSLGASGVFIAPIPDKIAIGIEVPNKSVQVVSIQEVIGSTAFETAKSNVAFAMGRDITGGCIVSDIAKLPHLLIAGTTGSGKSVCMNSLIVSILYKSTPEEVRLIMIDPKMVELGIYNGIPHLLVPVVTDPRKASGALQWAVLEMMKRYKLFADAGVRDMKGYNQHIEASGEGEKLPQIVIVIDELADLMVVARKEVEDSIMRLTQMARAAGMHLVIATQRPSVDVITGVIKSNIPSRIAFAVASKIESNIILGSAGAEKLIGRGDMLYAPIGTNKPTRIQGCFISDEEVEAVVKHVKGGKDATYSEEIIQQIEQQAEKAEREEAGMSGDPSGEEDEMLYAAIDVVMESGQASVSMLQRRLKLGYSRAARIVDQMEERGIVGPFEGAKPRKILVSREQWQEIKMRRESL
ncbi:MAG: DNA translocase FtsK [Oscillospiraceae bacterium]|nr:DNA translocase FtsK [Oscillospiraceae bacterium]